MCVSGELLICHLSIHIISFECPLQKKERKKRKKKKKPKEKERERKKRGLFCDCSFASGGALCLRLCPGSRL